MFGADVNAKLELWFSGGEDKGGGTKVKEFIFMNSLFIE